jgi:hypothetical protein
MSHTACRVKLSSTLVYGATRRWTKDVRMRMENAGRSARLRDDVMAAEVTLNLVCGDGGDCGG